MAVASSGTRGDAGPSQESIKKLDQIIQVGFLPVRPS